MKPKIQLKDNKSKPWRFSEEVALAVKEYSSLVGDKVNESTSEEGSKVAEAGMKKLESPNVDVSNQSEYDDQDISLLTDASGNLFSADKILRQIFELEVSPQNRPNVKATKQKLPDQEVHIRPAKRKSFLKSISMKKSQSPRVLSSPSKPFPTETSHLPTSSPSACFICALQCQVEEDDHLACCIDCKKVQAKLLKTSARKVKRLKHSFRGVRDVVRSDDWVTNCKSKTDQARRQKVVLVVSRTSRPAPIQDLSTMKSSSKVAKTVRNSNTSVIVTNETIHGSDQFESGEENKPEVEHDCVDVETPSTSVVKSIATPSPSSPPHISTDPKMSLLLPTDPVYRVKTRDSLSSRAPASSCTVQQSAVENLLEKVTATPNLPIARPSPGSPPVPVALSVKQNRRSSFRRECPSCGQLSLLPRQAVCCDSCVAAQGKLFRQWRGENNGRTGVIVANM